MFISVCKAIKKFWSNTKLTNKVRLRSQVVAYVVNRKMLPIEKCVTSRRRGKVTAKSLCIRCKLIKCNKLRIRLDDSVEFRINFGAALSQSDRVGVSLFYNIPIDRRMMRRANMNYLHSSSINQRTVTNNSAHQFEKVERFLTPIISNKMIKQPSHFHS